MGYISPLQGGRERPKGEDKPVFSKKHEVQEIAQEKLEDPSEDLFKVEEEAKSCNPFADFIVNDTETNQLCKYFSKRVCIYSHEILDCNEHVNNGICHRENCTKRHRQYCKFYNNRKGCDRKSNCAFLHMDRPLATEEGGDKHRSWTSAKKEAQINELEYSIKVMIKVMNEKVVEIEHNRKELDKLKLELENKVAEIQEN